MKTAWIILGSFLSAFLIVNTILILNWVGNIFKWRGEIMKLIDGSILVRNTGNDADFKNFFEQGVRLIKVLKAAQEALEEKDNARGQDLS